MADDIKIEGHPLEALIKELAAATSKATAFEVVGNYLVDYAVGVGRPGFAYKTPFPKTSPGCVSGFSRQFTHKDWRDGQDLVQAEQSAGEDGFNFRFHQIEGDLDALRDDLKKAFDCMASMRASLHDLLAEIRTELNLVNGDLNRLEECCRQRPLPEALPDRSIHTGTLIGPVDWFGKRSLAFQTEKGITVLPTVDGPDDGLGDPRIKRVAALGKLLAVDKRILKAFNNGPVTKETLLENFADIELDGGWTFGDALDILPSGSRFASTDTLLKGISEREAAALRTSGLADGALAIELGGLGDHGPVKDAPLEGFELVPEPARNALIAAGMNTVGDLAGRDPVDIAAVLQSENVEGGVGAAAGWIAAAQMMSSVR